MRPEPKVIFHVGGPASHPVADQARLIAGWIGDGYKCELHDGLGAFEQLDRADLLVLMGLHWSGMEKEKLAYRPLQQKHKEAFEQYISSGKPLLAHHAAVGSYDDWQRFGELVGVQWIWGKSNHSPLGEHHVHVKETAHPVIAGVDDYTIYDELYYDLKIDEAMQPEIEAEATWEGKKHPMVITGHGGRVDGAGKMVYLANGHDMRSFECEAMHTLWSNAVAWLAG